MNNCTINKTYLGAEECLVILLSKSILSNKEQSQLLSLIDSHLDWSKVIGLLQVHRLSAIAWKNLKKYLFSKKNFSWKFSKIFKLCEQTYNIQKSNMSYQLHYTLEICNKLDEEGIDYAILKGIVLSNFIYGDIALRDFNDCDILINAEQINDVKKILEDSKYMQGKFDANSNKIIPYSRKELLISPLVSHELRPFLKKMDNNSYYNLHVVDVQFSLDLLTSNRTDDLVSLLLKNRIKLNMKNGYLYSLQWEDMLLFLCLHFYKEATNLSEVLTYKDMLLYKLCDIERMISSNEIKLDFDKFIINAQEYGIVDAVYYALYYCNLVYENIPSNLMERIAPKDICFLDKVFHREKLVYIWNDERIDRIFNLNRAKDLENIQQR